MKILFVSLCAIENVENQHIYTDLLRIFRSRGHEVWAIAPREKRCGLATEFVDDHGIRLIHVAIGDIQKTNFIKKGFSTLSLNRRFVRALDEFAPDEKFDLVLYVTPPTTISGLVRQVKDKTGAKAYLLLKDIFPQNSLDLGILSAKGIRGLLYRYFKKTERKTYAVADWIGCMSRANLEYLLEHQPDLDAARIEVNPNSLIPRDMTEVSPSYFREKYDIPSDQIVFAYGGNLGKPQDIDFLISVLDLNEDNPAGFFLIAGEGTERRRLEAFFSKKRLHHARLLPRLPRKEFDEMLCACDVGMIVLDYRFTIPNFPSRMLSYMQASLPVITATDMTTDIGLVVEENGFGVSAFSNDAQDFLGKCREIARGDLREMGRKARECLENQYTAERTYQIIMEHFNEN